MESTGVEYIAKVRIITQTLAPITIAEKIVIDLVAESLQAELQALVDEHLHQRLNGKEPEMHHLPQPIEPERPATESPLEIPTQGQSLRNAISSLEATTELLAGRLAPLMADPTAKPAGAEAAPDRIESEVARELMNMAYRVWTCNETLLGVLARLQL